MLFLSPLSMEAMPYLYAPSFTSKSPVCGLVLYKSSILNYNKHSTLLAISLYTVGPVESVP